MFCFMFRDVLFVNWIPFGASLMKKMWEKVIVYKYLMPMKADILILGVTVIKLCAACIRIVD